MKTIRLLPPETRVLLKEETRRKLFSDKDRTAKKLKIKRKSVNNWIRGDFRPSLEQLKKLGMNLTSESFFTNIEEFGLGKSKFDFKLPSEIELNKVSWLLGIMEGDRAESKNAGIGLTNENEDLIKEFITNLEIFNLDKKDFRLKIQITNGGDIDKEKFSKKFELPFNRITISRSEIPRKSPVIQIILKSKIFAEIFRRLNEIILSSKEVDNETKSKFIKGFCDAEGSVNSKKLTIEIKQKNTSQGKELISNVSNMLNSLNIQNKINGPNCENMLVIRLFGGKKNLENLKRFSTLIGFVSSEKQEKLNKILQNS